GRRDQPGRQRGRAARHAVTLQHEHRLALLDRGKGCDHAGGASADHEAIDRDIEAAVDRLDAAHGASISRIISAIPATRQTGFSAAIAMSCVSALKAAQPSSSTMVSKSRMCASRTVVATPPLVTMPAIMSFSILHLRRTHSIRVM